MSLDEMFSKLTMPSGTEIKKIQSAAAGNLSPITVCQCGLKQISHRLGCACGGNVRHLWQDRSGSILECGTDFSPMPICEVDNGTF